MIRIVIVALIGLLPYSVLAQNSYTIQGKIGKEYASNTVYLRYTQQGVKVTDSARVKRGKYRFKGQVLEPSMASITGFNPNNSPSEQVDASVRRDYLYFYLENSKISIESDSGLRNSSIKGSKTEEENR